MKSLNGDCVAKMEPHKARWFFSLFYLRDGILFALLGLVTRKASSFHENFVTVFLP